MATKKVESVVEDRSTDMTKRGLAEKMMPAMMVVMLVMAFGLGAMWSKIKYLEAGGVGVGTTAGTAQQAAVQPQAVEVSQDMISGLFEKDVIKFGNANSKLVFVEIADPSCPYCHIAAGKNPELNKSAGAQFTLVADGGTYVAPVEEMRKLVDSGEASYIYLYSNGHGNGELAQKALYCANERGRFWQVHDKLMTNDGYNLINNEVRNDKANAQKLADFLQGTVDTNFLVDCLESGKYDARISADQQLAGSLGVQGTPGFFVNTARYGGAYSWTDMKTAAESALN